MAYITTVRGRLRSNDPAEAMQAHNDIVDRLRPRGEPFGGVGHHTFVDPQDPQAFLAIDDWESVEGLQRFMGDPSVQAEIGGLFDGPPDVTVWAAREGWRAY